MATGLKSATYDYNAFGETIQSDGVASVANHFRFSTKYTDDETGLYYYGYRYYAPSTGRWLSRDPIEERGGKNLYGFVLNAPIGLIDYLGRDPVEPMGTLQQLYPGQAAQLDKAMIKLPTNLGPKPDSTMGVTDLFGIIVLAKLAS